MCQLNRPFQVFFFFFFSTFDKQAEHAEHAGIHDNPESGNYPGTLTLIESVKILSLPTYILTMANRRVTDEREI